MSIMRWAAAILVALSVTGWAAVSRAQEEAGPQVMTSDLAVENEVQTDSLTASFVVVSDANITALSINGEPQQFTPGDTVQVTKTFKFTKPRTLITLSATDQNGKTKERTWAVNFKNAPVEKALTWAVTVKAAEEVDTNPTLDLSSPIAIKGVDIKGVVKDSKQSDTRTTLQGDGSITYGQWTGFVGAYEQVYGKADNKGLKVLATYAGGTGRFNMGGTRDFLATYTFTDLNIGDNDYAQMHTITPAFEFRSEDNKGSYTHTLALDYTQKNFASGSQTDGGQADVRWNYHRLNADKLNQFDSVIALGNYTEGIKEQDYSYVGFNTDWIYRWDTGLRIDWGLGFEYRDFPDDKQPLTKQFGETRLDTLWRASLGAGWQFNPKWSAMFGYRYLTDISNKSPYVRQIYGVTVDGAF